MKKVFLGVGHGGKDPGAVGYIKEADVNLNMALACRDYLVANGVEVQMSRTKDENDDLNEEIRECNAYNPDLAVDIHNNAGGGDGFEVYHTLNGGVGKTLAQNIEAEVLAIGQNSRGLKTRRGNNGDYYGFIRCIKCPSIIVEGVFVDNAADAAQADTLEEQKTFGVAYAKGILKTLGIIPSDKPVTPEPVPTPSEPTKELGVIGKIQQTLNSRYGLNIAVDGIAGKETKKAIVIGLQKELNSQFNRSLDVDGIFGPKTKKACVTLKNGARGNITWLLQARLVCLGYNIAVDGIFGNGTLSAVKQFQKSKGISVDGIVGETTWEKLLA